MEDSPSMNADAVKTSTNGTSAGAAKGVLASTQISTKDSVANESKRSFRDWIIIYLRAYGAALIGSVAIVPILASAVTIGLYLTEVPQLTQTTPSWHSVAFGALYTYIAWWVIAVFYSPLTAGRLVNTTSYGLLKSRLNQLEARLHEIDAEGKTKNWAEYQRVALREARDKIEDLKSYLHRYPVGLPWVLSLGYVDVWSRLHRAEEALIEVEPVEMVVRGALHDKLAIQDSQISSRDELLQKLQQAVKELNPAMESDFKKNRPVQENEEIHKLFHYIKGIAIKAGVNLDDDLSSRGNANQPISAEAEGRARFIAREVRRTLNEYRDRLWEGLVRVRNHLLATIFVTGFVAHILLCIAILEGVPTLADPAPNRDAIIAAAIFYIVGATAGLFGRIYRESRISTAVDDYGLSFVRLIATPLLSGLAGVGGVLIYGTVVSGGITILSNRVQNIFDLSRLDYLIAAAVFGLAPNLIVRSLQERSEKYLSALQSSKGAETQTNGSDSGQ